MRLKAIVITLALSFNQNAFAGMSIEVKKVCPVGGEKFKVTATTSCSTMGRTMSLQPRTSCDFITHLPQCPSNNLPMYKEFSDADITELKTFMQTTTYKGTTSKSSYFLAALIERTLTSGDEETEFFLLQQGLWYTPKQSYNEPIYMTAYHQAVKTMAENENFEEAPFWLGAEAMVYLTEGNTESAKNNIKRMNTDKEASQDFLTSYKKALQFCLTHMDDKKLCNPTSALRDHDN